MSEMVKVMHKYIEVKTYELMCGHCGRWWPMRMREVEGKNTLHCPYCGKSGEVAEATASDLADTLQSISLDR